MYFYAYLKSHDYFTFLFVYKRWSVFVCKSIMYKVLLVKCTCFNVFVSFLGKFLACFH